MASYERTALFDQAIELLQEAERMHRQFFRLATGHTGPCWEPPVDLVESAHGLLIRVALPGVAAEALQVVTDGSSLSVVGFRPLGAGPGETIHRLEIPYGRFERRIELPAGRYELLQRELAAGCLVIRLRRLA
jgi:HSP20 family molecular chaperone IbpA